MRNAPAVAVAIPLSAILLYVALRGVEWRLVWSTVSSARPSYLVLACFMAIFTYFLRSVRWRVLLNTRGRLSLAVVFWATMAGYMCNALLPARAGEVFRSLIVSSRSDLSKTYVLTTALTERLLDAVTLVAVGSTILIYIETGPLWLAQSARGAGVVAAAGLVLLIILPRMEALLHKTLLRLPIPASFRIRLDAILGQLLTGARSLHHPKRLFGFSVLTSAIWLLDALGSVITARALGLNLTITAALLLLSGLGLGSALPSAPGYIGVYQFVAVTVLMPFGFSRSEALAYILTAQFFNYLLVCTCGGIAMSQFRRVRTGENGILTGSAR